VLEELNNLFKKIFSNEETLIFALLLCIGFLIIFFLGNILTPFLMSLIFAYLLIGMQKRLEAYGLNSTVALIFTYSFFLLIGIALMVWLVPLVYQQLQSLVLEIPKWVKTFTVFIQTVPENYPDLVSSDQITTFFKASQVKLPQFLRSF